MIPSTIMGEQQDYYRENEAYADFLDNWDAGFYAKYAYAYALLGPTAKCWTLAAALGRSCNG